MEDEIKAFSKEKVPDAIAPLVADLSLKRVPVVVTTVGHRLVSEMMRPTLLAMCNEETEKQRVVVQEIYKAEAEDFRKETQEIFKQESENYRNTVQEIFKEELEKQRKVVQKMGIKKSNRWWGIFSGISSPKNSSKLSNKSEGVLIMKRVGLVSAVFLLLAIFFYGIMRQRISPVANPNAIVSAHGVVKDVIKTEPVPRQSEDIQVSDAKTGNEGIIPTVFLPQDNNLVDAPSIDSDDCDTDSDDTNV